MPKIYKGNIIENKPIGGLFLLTVSIEEEISVNPGQFFLIRIDREDIVLRRAFSIFDVNGDRLSFLYRVVGRGTKWLSERRVGYTLNIFGPLGNGFSLCQGKSLLVGGGSGMAPLYYLGKRLREGIKFLLGAQTKDFWDDDLLLKYSNVGEIEVITEDGSLGKKGLVTEYIDTGYDRIYACGPVEMLKNIRVDIPTEISLETIIACGFGACRGCVVETKNGEYKRVCKDGPVFDLKEIF
ncbi:MAG: dihydroorotate dehydrogenase electron transfer subunit [bacterium]|nr:dihydroorotate dehydrogenase electron transfer subunit [bacterium]